MVLRILTRAPHDVRKSNVIRMKIQKKTEKNKILLRISYKKKKIAENRKSRKKKSYIQSLAKLVFFLFFSFFSHESYSVSLQHVVPLWKSSIPYKHSLFWRRKKRPVWANYIWDPYTRGSKKAPEKSRFFLNLCPVSLISKKKRSLSTDERCLRKKPAPPIWSRWFRKNKDPYEHAKGIIAVQIPNKTGPPPI